MSKRRICAQRTVDQRLVCHHRRRPVEHDHAAPARKHADPGQRRRECHCLADRAQQCGGLWGRYCQEHDVVGVLHAVAVHKGLSSARAGHRLVAAAAEWSAIRSARWLGKDSETSFEEEVDDDRRAPLNDERPPHSSSRTEPRAARGCSGWGRRRPRRGRPAGRAPRVRIRPRDA